MPHLSIRYGVPVTVIPLEQSAVVPGARLCDSIVNGGGTSGSKSTPPVKPALAHFPFAVAECVPIRIGTVQIAWVGATVG
jgi:hypothetical protein